MQIYFDPDEAERFAARLDEETGQMRETLRAVSIVLVELNADWKDSRYDRYMAIFDRNTESLMRFFGEADRYAAYLRKNAAIIREYLG